jgi:hypothetical protein
MKIVLGAEFEDGRVVTAAIETDDDFLQGVRPGSVVIRQLVAGLGDRLVEKVGQTEAPFNARSRRSTRLA